MIKSHLKENLTEHINAEIAQGTITDIETGINWLKNTFMYIRMKNDLLNKKNFNLNKKNLYFSFDQKNKLNNNDLASKAISELEKELETQLHGICLKIFKDLASIRLIDLQEDKNFAVKTNKLGEKMSKNYVLFETIKQMTTLSDNSEETILECISNAFEFSKYRSKIEDRKILNNYNKDNSIKYKVKGVIDTFNKKAFLMLQAAFSSLPLEPWELRRQQNEMLQSSLRILNCVKQIFKEKDDVKGLVQILLLKKTISQKMWTNSDLFLKQFPKIGDKIAKNLSRGGIISFERLINENARKIELLSGKNAPFGNILIDMAKSIPKCELRFEIVKLHNRVANNKNNDLNTNSNMSNKNQSNISCKLSLFCKVIYNQQIVQEDFDPITCYFVLVADNKNKLLLKRKLKHSSNDREITLNIINKITMESFPIVIYIICEKFIGLDRMITITNENDSTGISSTFINLTNKTLNDYKNIPVTVTSSTLNQNLNNSLMGNSNNSFNQNKKAAENKSSNSNYTNINENNSSFNKNKDIKQEKNDEEIDKYLLEIINEEGWNSKQRDDTIDVNVSAFAKNEKDKKKAKRPRKANAANTRKNKEINNNNLIGDNNNNNKNENMNILALLNNMKNSDNKKKNSKITKNVPESSNKPDDMGLSNHNPNFSYFVLEDTTNNDKFKVVNKKLEFLKNFPSCDLKENQNNSNITQINHKPDNILNIQSSNISRPESYINNSINFFTENFSNNQTQNNNVTKKDKKEMKFLIDFEDFI